jgi:hypothetical protein
LHPLFAAGEIGVPPYFAMRLSFPEAVTPHNVEHLRQLVRNGANKYPGALAVEDCAGRVISLNKLDEKVRRGLRALYCFLVASHTAVQLPQPMAYATPATLPVQSLSTCMSTTAS